jgi:ribosome-associated toxin RatA of RatAB toxin-antitoxin module
MTGFILCLMALLAIGPSQGFAQDLDSVLNDASNSLLWIGDTRYGKSIPESKLAPQKPVISYHELPDGSYEVDAAGVLETNAESVFRVSLDYGHYKEFAPFVLDSRIVETTNDDKTWPPSDYYIWTKMRYTGRYARIEKSIITRYYLHVQPQQNVVIHGDFATRWVLLKEPRPSWKYPTRSYFSVFDGSWYIVPLSAQRTYVRYFAKIKLDMSMMDWWMPEDIVKEVFKKSLKSNVTKLLLAIEQRAKQQEALQDTLRDERKAGNDAPSSANDRGP